MIHVACKSKLTTFSCEVRDLWSQSGVWLCILPGLDWTQLPFCTRKWQSGKHLDEQ